MAAFLSGIIVGVVLTILGLLGLVWFLETYDVEDVRETPKGLKLMFLEVWRSICWVFRPKKRYEPLGTIPEVGDIVVFGRQRLKIVRKDHYTAYGEGTTRKPFKSVINLHARLFIDSPWDASNGKNQWRIMKRPKEVDTTTHWWAEKTVQELNVDRWPDPRKKRRYSRRGGRKAKKKGQPAGGNYFTSDEYSTNITTGSP